MCTSGLKSVGLGMGVASTTGGLVCQGHCV